MNEMKRVNGILLQKIKRDDEVVPENNFQNEPDLYDNLSYDEDYSKYWTDYDTFGYDKRRKRALGSMKKKVEIKKKRGPPNMQNKKYA